MQSPSYLTHKPHLLTYSPKKKKIRAKSHKMATCNKQCYHFLLATQASIRHNLYNCLITSLSSLRTLERYLGQIQTPGWSPMSREKTQRIMENAKQARLQSAEDLRKINDILREGCPSCKLRQNNAQQIQLPVITDEMMETIDQLAENGL